MEFLTTRRVTERNSKQRIDLFLSREFSYLSRSEWQREIQRGKISHNGVKLTRYDKKIYAGDVITYAGRDAAEPEVDGAYTVLYEDQYLVAVNKPGNLPVHPAGVFYNNTLLTLMQNQYQKKLHLLHRLDRETSGIVLLAKDPSVASAMHANFESIAKSYLAVVHGVPDHHKFTISIPIGFDQTSTIKHKRMACEKAREAACTTFITIASRRGLSLLKVVPHTGRQHQIRVHLKHAGYPIVGDKMYGIDDTVFHEFMRTGPTEEIIRKLGFKRSALHSRSLLVKHPILHRMILIKAPLHEDMKSLITQMWGADV